MVAIGNLIINGDRYGLVEEYELMSTKDTL